MYFNIKCMGKLPGLTNEFEGSLVFETGEFERPKFDCICKVQINRKEIRLHSNFTMLSTVGDITISKLNTQNILSNLHKYRVYMFNHNTKFEYKGMKSA